MHALSLSSLGMIPPSSLLSAYRPRQYVNPAAEVSILVNHGLIKLQQKQISNIIHRTFVAAKITSHLEPHGISLSDGKKAILCNFGTMDMRKTTYIGCNLLKYLI